MTKDTLYKLAGYVAAIALILILMDITDYGRKGWQETDKSCQFNEWCYVPSEQERKERKCSAAYSDYYRGYCYAS